MRRFVRWLLVTLAGGLVIAVAYGVVQEFFIEWAREEGWYKAPSQKLDAAMTAVSSLVTQTWFLVVTALFVGLALGAWLDTLLRFVEQTKSPVIFVLSEQFPYIQERRGTWDNPDVVVRYWYLGVRNISKHKVDTLNVIFDRMVDREGHEIHSRLARGGGILWPGEETLVNIAAMHKGQHQKKIIVNGGEYDNPPYFIHFSATTAKHKIRTTCQIHVDQDGLLQAALISRQSMESYANVS